MPDAGRTVLRGRFMSIKASWGLTVLLAATALVGCGQSRQLVRGQSPSNAAPAESAPVENMGPIIGSAPGYADQVRGHKSGHTGHDFKAYNGFRDNNFGYDGGYYAGPQGYYTDRDRTYTTANSAAGCPACEYGRGCPQGGCQHCGCRGGCNEGNSGPGGCPQHYQTYRYDWPQNTVAPPTEMPAAMVQYPYYTFRGPTDFFMK